MENKSEQADYGTVKRYAILIKMIHDAQSRMTWSEMSFLALDLVTAFFSLQYVARLVRHSEQSHAISPVEFSLAVLCLSAGVFLSAYWMATALRLQLKLKLRYFQARYLERKMNVPGEHFISDEECFFNKEIPLLASPDNKETLSFPDSLDGTIGRAKPRHLTTYMPLYFFTLYVILFIWTTAQFIEHI